MKKNAILFFEPLNHMFKVMINAHARGYRVLVFHQSEMLVSQPYESAVDYIDESWQVKSWYDYGYLESLLHLCQEKYDIVGTYAGAEATLLFEAKVRKLVGLPGNPISKTSRNLNKLKVRKLLISNGLSNLQCFDEYEIGELSAWPFDRDAYFKPVNGAGSVNVWCCNSLQDVKSCQKRWQDKDEIIYELLREYIEWNDNYFLEEAAHGTLISVESIVYEGKVTIIGFTSRERLKRDPAIEMGLLFPYEHPLKNEIIARVKAYHRVMEINHGATHAEIIISDCGRVELIEMNLRFAGYDMLSVISESLQQDFADILLDLSLGKNPYINICPTKAAGLLMVMPPLDLQTFDSIDFPEDILFHKLMKPLGKRLSSTQNQIDYLGSCVYVADTYEQLSRKAQNIRQKIKVNKQPIEQCDNNQVIVNQ